jgi:hypothetical protein
MNVEDASADNLAVANHSPPQKKDSKPKLFAPLGSVGTDVKKPGQSVPQEDDVEEEQEDGVEGEEEEGEDDGAEGSSQEDESGDGKTPP